MNRPILLVFILVFCAGTVAGNPVIVPLVDVIEFQPTSEVSLAVVPDGSGTPFAGAWNGDGVPVDATLRIWLVDDQGYPMDGFLAGDVWLRFPEYQGTVASCVEIPYSGDVFFPDGDSDGDGMMQWTLPLRGGGWSEGPVELWIYGMRAMAPDFSEVPPLPIRVNSPDVNGDLEVDLTDITLFAQDLGGPYNFRSDLCWDGGIDLSDIVIFAQGIGAICP